MQHPSFDYSFQSPIDDSILRLLDRPGGIRATHHPSLGGRRATSPERMPEGNDRDHSDLSSTERTVYAAILKFQGTGRLLRAETSRKRDRVRANHFGISELASETGLSVTSVSRSLMLLSASGLIDWAAGWESGAGSANGARAGLTNRNWEAENWEPTEEEEWELRARAALERFRFLYGGKWVAPEMRGKGKRGREERRVG